ncbi:helix-hairpin-helix domain-containing protein [Actinoplanes sp. NPDC049265]|uniref:helix-hairpin-helix domain-containing protein n=1 Tax=Actinoplanes sp. NPDC049265 TaxID=3363902 RepID=UPI00371AD5C1
MTEPVAVTEPVVEAEPAPKPHFDGGLVEDEPVGSPKPHDQGGLVEDSSVATAEPHVSGGLVADPAPEPLPAPRPGEIGVAPVDEPEPAPVPRPHEMSAVEPEAAPAPAIVPAQRDGDDLKRLEGIGPKMAAALNAAGIGTYAQLAAADDDVIRAAVAAAKMRRPSTAGTWPRQAQLLADGDEAGFVALARTLKGRS